MRLTDCVNTEGAFGNARRDTEKELGRPITSAENYLSEPEKRKKIEDKA